MDVNGNYQALLPNGHQQLAILNRTAKRPSLRFQDRLFWGALAKCWQDWRYALLIVKPETVIKWRRQWFRLYWRWKSKTGRPGRPRIDTKIRELIPRISQENLLWGTPRIQSELSLLPEALGWHFRYPQLFHSPNRCVFSLKKRDDHEQNVQQLLDQ